MRTLIGSDLALLGLLVVVVLVVTYSLPPSILRVILGVPFILFCPGYSLISALYPRKLAIDGGQRWALSLGLSMVIVMLFGLALNYSPWGITLEPVLYSNAAFILTMAAVTWVRRRGLPVEERFRIEFRLRRPGWNGNTWDRALSVLLVVSVIGAVATVSYIIARPKAGDQFTEFYILGAEAKAADYPRELKLGESAQVTVGIINRERQTLAFRLEAVAEEVLVGEPVLIVLADNEEWEQPVTFIPQMVGDNQEVEFLLYLDGDPEAYLGPLRLWVDVVE